MVSTLSDMRIWSKALATGSLLKPAVWREAQRNMVPFVFAGNYNGPGQWRYGLGFVESGGFIGAEGSFAGYESATMYSPALDTRHRRRVDQEPQRHHSPADDPGARHGGLSAPTSASGSRPPRRSDPTTSTPAPTE